MSAGIAHEFKNALATISGYAQMIHQEAPAGELLENSERILEQTRALTHVVTEFLRFAKPLELSYETLPIESLVLRVADEIQEAVPGCAIRTAGDFCDVPGDEGLLRQALLNLTRNAAEAARSRGAQGRVNITGTFEDRAGRKWQRISVADNGPGIPTADLSKVFLPFFTTKSEGTGLVLRSCKKSPCNTAAPSKLSNLPEGGAEFILWLPLRQAPVAPDFVQTGRAHLNSGDPGGIRSRKAVCMRIRLTIAPAVLVLLASYGAAAQDNQSASQQNPPAQSQSAPSLADAARKARETKKTEPKPAKVFTNDNLPATGN